MVAISVANLPGPAGWPVADRVFEKYSRSGQAYRWTGSGLGLYLVAGFARALKGHVHYEPTAEQIVFTLYLPLSSQEP